MKKFYLSLILCLSVFFVGTFVVSPSCLDIINMRYNRDWWPTPVVTNHCVVDTNNNNNDCSVDSRVYGKIIAGTIMGVLGVIACICIIWLLVDISMDFWKGKLGVINKNKCKYELAYKKNLRGVELRPKYGCVSDVKPRRRRVIPKKSVSKRKK